MPEEGYWESLFDVPLILDRLRIDPEVGDVVELGCGYGTFTIPVARRVSGRVISFDINPGMVERTRRRAESEGLVNVSCILRDVAAEGYGLAAGSVDGCLLFNILHCEDPVDLLARSAEVVREGGSVWVIHWRCDPSTPRGPSMEIRPRPGQIVKWAEQTGLLEAESEPLDLPPWHYGLRLRRTDAR